MNIYCYSYYILSYLNSLESCYSNFENKTISYCIY